MTGCISRRDAVWLAAILALSLAVHVGWLSLYPELPGEYPPSRLAFTRWDPVHYDELAMRMAAGQGYVDLNGEPTAYRAPGYPAFLAGLYEVFGRSRWVGGTANAVLWTLAATLTYALACQMLTPGRSLLAAAALAFLPVHLFRYTAILWNESLYTALALACLLTAFLLVRRPGWRLAALLGVLIGVSVYVRPTLLLLPLLLPVLLTLNGVSCRRALPMAAVVMAVAIICVAPWSVRNYVMMGDFVPLSTNAGVNLYIGNGPGATGKYRGVGMSAEESEADLNRKYRRLAVERVVSDPVGWVRVLPAKAFYLWAASGGRLQVRSLPGVEFLMWLWTIQFIAQSYWMALAIGAVFALGRPALRRYWRRRWEGVFLWGTLAYWTCFHLAFFGMGRFHLPVAALVVIIAFHVASDGGLESRGAAERRSRGGRWRGRAALALRRLL